MVQIRRGVLLHQPEFLRDRHDMRVQRHQQLALRIPFPQPSIDRRVPPYHPPQEEIQAFVGTCLSIGYQWLACFRETIGDDRRQSSRLFCAIAVFIATTAIRPQASVCHRQLTQGFAHGSHIAMAVDAIERLAVVGKDFFKTF